MTRAEFDKSIETLLVFFEPPYNSEAANKDFFENYWRMAHTKDGRSWMDAADLLMQRREYRSFPLPGEFLKYYESVASGRRGVDGASQDECPPGYERLMVTDREIYELSKEERDELQRQATKQIKEEHDRALSRIEDPKGFVTVKTLFLVSEILIRAKVKQRMRDIYEKGDVLL